MDIKIRKKTSEPKRLSFDDLEPGTVFEFKGGSIALKMKKTSLQDKGYILIVWGYNSEEAFKCGDGSMIAWGIAKVHGKLVGLEVEPI